MIPSESFVFKSNKRKHRENYQGYYFLNDFKLQQSKRTAIVFKPNAVGRYLKKILR
jgi:hypothetical protein